MKILVVAHPDDEILWFNPKDFDKIIICFNVRRIDRVEKNFGMFKSLMEHPLKDKILFFGLSGGEYWRKPNEFEAFNLRTNEKSLKNLLDNEILEADEIYTHNSWGEYGHSDHILVNKVVKEMAKCPVWCPNLLERKHKTTGKERKIIIDLNLYKKVKAIYTKYDCWTWEKNYLPLSEQEYFKENEI